MLPTGVGPGTPLECAGGASRAFGARFFGLLQLGEGIWGLWGFWWVWTGPGHPWGGCGAELPKVQCVFRVVTRRVTSGAHPDMAFLAQYGP